MSLHVALPIFAAAVAQLFGQTGEGMHTVEAFLRTVPPSVANVLAKPIGDVLAARSGTLLWLGAIVGLWTTASFVETIRDILRSEEHTSELQSLMRISYAVFCLKKKN